MRVSVWLLTECRGEPDLHAVFSEVVGSVYATTSVEERIAVALGVVVNAGIGWP